MKVCAFICAINFNPRDIAYSFFCRQLCGFLICSCAIMVCNGNHAQSFFEFPCAGYSPGHTDRFNCAFEALAQDRYGYEFTVRENLSRICLFLYGEFKPQADTQNAALNLDALRIRKMLDYIHRNYENDISVSEISGAAGISERKSLRCFRKTVQLSPSQYLLKYRIMQGAEMLLRNPAASISEIATMCGFDSPSNFTKIFRRFYNCSPREYRKQKQ